MSEKPNSSRRDFIGATWLNQDSDNLSDPDSSALASPLAQQQDRKNSHLECYSKNAMACQFELMFNMHQYPDAAETALQAFQLIDRLEDQLTVYSDSSEISFVNREAASEKVVVDSQLFDLLHLCRQLSEQTGGAFDITSGPLSDAWGFSRREGRIPSEDEIQNALRKVSYKKCFLDQQTVHFGNDGIQLNLGGIGKGFAIDRAVELIAQRAIEDFVFHGGQSSVVARGDNSNSSGEVGWKVGLSDPVHPNRRLAEVRLCNEALGTSGTGRQGFFFRGKRFGHIIDPRNGYPTDHFLSTTVVSPSAAICDALATAFFVMPLDEVQTYCDRHPHIKAIIVIQSRDSDSRQLETFNVPDGMLELNPKKVPGSPSSDESQP